MITQPLEIAVVLFIGEPMDTGDLPCKESRHQQKEDKVYGVPFAEYAEEGVIDDADDPVSYGYVLDVRNNFLPCTNIRRVRAGDS